VLVGVFVSVTLELCGIHSLSFAVGSYLPIATTAPIFAGGVVRWLVERRTGITSYSDISAGVLFSSGLIAGGSLAGILFALLVSLRQQGLDILSPLQAVGNAIPYFHDESTTAQIVSALLFTALGVILYRAGQRRLE
jgi:hypothetical protein